MNIRFTLAFLIAGCLLIGCSNSPAHRIAECEKAGGTAAACTATEWDYEKAHPLATAGATPADQTAALQDAFNKSLNRSKP